MEPLTCRLCGSKMKRVAKSLAQGIATCHGCRRALPKPSASPRGDLTCADCGAVMWRSRTSRPQGEARCLACKRASAAATPKWTPELRQCCGCAAAYLATVRTQKYCNAACRQSTSTWRGSRPSAVAHRQKYGVAHRKERARVAMDVAAGAATCHFCSRTIDPGSDWHLDHTEDGTAYRGPAHALCNLQDGARIGRKRRDMAGVR